jgi:2-polyprenyl-3-methyl-5-hydroxy-6-metoxy-1,4-benzoquinol methylase
MDKAALKVVECYDSLLGRAYAYLRFKIAPIEKVKKFVPKKGSILDVGCGYGVAAAYIAIKSGKRHVVGTDFNEKRIAKAKKSFENLKNVEFFFEDLISAKSKRKFDCILLIDVVHHVESGRQKGLLEACRKHLRTHGVMIIKDIDRKPVMKYLWNYLHDFLLNDGPLCFNSHEKLCGMAKKAGFIAEYKELGNFFYPHFMLICKAN